MTAKACNSPDSCECCRDWLETKKMMDMSVAELRAELERIKADTGEWDAQAEIERLRSALSAIAARADGTMGGCAAIREIVYAALRGEEQA